jgi:hypothetical protein
MSNGLVMTLGADVSPPDRRAEFLAAWRLTHDTGSLTGPLVVGAVAAVSACGAGAAESAFGFEHANSAASANTPTVLEASVEM